jgi:hypothetical protein
VPPAGLTREERLAAALRANLRRRKAQARARADAGGETQPPAAETGPDSTAGGITSHPEDAAPESGSRNTR